MNPLWKYLNDRIGTGTTTGRKPPEKRSPHFPKTASSSRSARVFAGTAFRAYFAARIPSRTHPS
ncbi:MAG: hypothetical protein A2Z13_02275 [Deltaproteobacteria bacterium RBG_16_64_85]|nr:MAG: hypothetical protein A2Z13_02275 [Deltaproteobacteria bacterium RBG_16_64_85]